MGRQLKQSVNVFHNLILNRRLPEKIVSKNQFSGKQENISFQKMGGHTENVLTDYVSNL